MTAGQDLYERAKRRIPGGTQLLSKRPETLLPGGWPAYYRSARGCELEDLDGRRFIDVSLHAVGACPLGYADPDVDRAVIEAIRAGSTATLNAPEEVELAERLCAIHPWADTVRYARGGGEAMAIAVRIARAATGRERIAFAGYHGWHDWYLAANVDDRDALDGHLLPRLGVAGVPGALAGTAVPFASGDPAALDVVIDRHGDALAAIVLEPARYALPPPGYLDHVRGVATRIGAILIFDEITCGFRMNAGGLHRRLGVAPDIAVFAKGIGNGYPMAAVLGRREVMEAVLRTFVSSTSWSERIGPAAALATIAKLERTNAGAHLSSMGDRMREGWEREARAHGLAIETRGIPPLPTFAFGYGERSKAIATLYTQEMLDRGFLASGAFYASLAHDDRAVDAALAATGESFRSIARALAEDAIEASLRGPVAHTGLRPA
jgi:glutamate-1-semialdehyde aminotransferase